MIPTVSKLFDLSRSPVDLIPFEGESPWLVLDAIGDMVMAVVRARPDFYTERSPGVFVGPGTVVSPTACLIGPAVFGADCEIRHAAFIRDRVIAGDGCIVGNSTELKNCILLDGAQAPHFAYVGDSVLGHKAHLGAGVILSNVRLDGRTIAVTAPAGDIQSDAGRPGAPDQRGPRIDTGLEKFGALVGDRAEIGCNSVVNPGTIIGRGVMVHPLTSVRGVVAEGSVIRNPGI